MWPFSIGSPSVAKAAGREPARLRIASSSDRNPCARCRVTITAAGRSAGRRPARKRKASTPPAEVPIVMMSRFGAVRCGSPMMGNPAMARSFRRIRLNVQAAAVYRGLIVRYPTLGVERVMTGNTDPDNQANKPIIVGIGASAGGVQALQALFGAIPDDTGAAFIVVLHLDPLGPSALREVPASRTKMPVEQVERSTRLEANKVYVIGPDRRLEVTDHQIASVEFDEPEDRRASIDLLFRSMADRLGDGCAIILSGA